MKNNADWVNLKKSIFITLGLLALAIALTLSSSEHEEGLAIIVTIAFIISLIVTGIKTIFYALKKGAVAATKIAKKAIRPKEEKEFLSFLEKQLNTKNNSQYIDANTKEKGAQLQINTNRVQELRSERMHQDLDEKISSIFQSSRFSDDDEASLNAIAYKHGIKLEYNDPSLKKYRLFHLIETTGDFELEPIDTDIRMSDSEECYFNSSATWRQEKRIRKNTGFIGGSFGVRIAKGISLRVGKAIPTYKEYDDIVDIDYGNLYLTNKKMVFLGQKKSTNITMGRLANYELYSDAIKIIKTSGNPDLFMLDPDDVVLLDVLLQKL